MYIFSYSAQRNELLSYCRINNYALIPRLLVFTTLKKNHNFKERERGGGDIRSQDILKKFINLNVREQRVVPPWFQQD